MGRGNICTKGEYEGLFYIDWSNFPNQFENENGQIQLDYGMQRDEWEQSLSLFVEQFQSKYKSFSETELWISQEEKAVLENDLFFVVIQDNEWAMAIKLIQKEENGYYNIQNLQKGHYQNYLSSIKDTLFNQFEEIGVYGGAWTSGKIKKD